jgi:hypothetical protein
MLYNSLILSIISLLYARRVLGVSARVSTSFTLEPFTLLLAWLLKLLAKAPVLKLQKLNRCAPVAAPIFNEIIVMFDASGLEKSIFIPCLNRMNDSIENCRVTGTIKRMVIIFMIYPSM